MALFWNKMIALVCYRPAEILVKAFISFSPTPLKENFFYILAFVLFRRFFIISWFFISVSRNKRELRLDEELAAAVNGSDFMLAAWAIPLLRIVKVVLTTIPFTLWEGLTIMTMVVISTIVCWWRRWRRPFDRPVDQQPVEGDMAIGWNRMVVILMYMLVDDFLMLFFAPKWILVWFFIYALTNIIFTWMKLRPATAHRDRRCHH